VANIYSLKDLQQLPTEPSEYIVEGLLRTNRKRPSLICGAPESGKSTLAIQLAKSVAQGISFLGRKTVKGKVLYWQSEEHVQDAKQDFLLDSSPTDPLLVVHPDPADDHCKVLGSLLDKHPDTKLVIIETLDDFLRTEDISDNNENRAQFERLEREVIGKHHQHCAFVILHWFKKSDTQTSAKSLNINKILGATVIAGKTDTKIYLRQVSDADQRRVVQASIRKGACIEPTYLLFDQANQTSRLGATVAEEKVQHSESIQSLKEMQITTDILTAVRSNQGSPKNQIVKSVGGDTRTTLGKINELIGTGELFSRTGGSKGTAHLLYTNDYAFPALAAQAEAARVSAQN
jgi:RecA-family ATPase